MFGLGIFYLYTLCKRAENRLCIFCTCQMCSVRAELRTGSVTLWYFIHLGPELQCLLKVKEDLS